MKTDKDLEATTAPVDSPPSPSVKSDQSRYSPDLSYLEPPSASPVSIDRSLVSLSPSTLSITTKTNLSAPSSTTKSTQSAQSSRSSSKSSSVPDTMKKASRSNRNKRSVHEMLAEDAEVENKMLDKLSNQKHERHLADLALKRQKLETQAAMSRQAAEERQQAAKHQREREREQHQLRILQLQYQMRSQGGGIGTNFGMGTGMGNMDDYSFDTSVDGLPTNLLT